jgi:hypothetical protein
MKPEPEHEEVFVLVKALPHPSVKHGETVCCAGVTPDSRWRRLFPVRFRQLKDNKFQRWDRLGYRWRKPTNDPRRESRHVFEDTFKVGDPLPKRERPRVLSPLIRSSVKEAIAKGESLTLIRPKDFKFTWKEKNKQQVADERAAYAAAGRQASLLDDALTKLEPCPFEFRVTFRDETGVHKHTCEDWETTAAYWNLDKRNGPDYALGHLDRMYNHEYQENGMVLALGNMAARPQTWLLLGLVRLDEQKQGLLL